MFTGLIVVTLTIAALVMCVAGFMANTRRFESKMRSPGLYWTWGVVALVAIGFLIYTPWWVRVASLLVLAATAWTWASDSKSEADAR